MTDVNILTAMHHTAVLQLYCSHHVHEMSDIMPIVHALMPGITRNIYT